MKSGRDTHYSNWTTNSFGSNQVWTRHKRGSDSKPTIVMTTGPVAIGPQNNRVFEKLATRYSGNLLAIETPGQGRSDHLGKRENISRYAEELLFIVTKVFPSLPVSSCTFVGHCFGAAIVNNLAGTEVVASTVLLSPIDGSLIDVFGLSAKIYAKAGANALARLTGSKNRRDLLADVIAPPDFNSDQIRTAQSMLRTAAVLGSVFFGPTVNNSPTIIVRGEFDHQSSVEVTERIARNIGPNASVKHIKGVGHMVQLYSSEEVANYIIEATDS